MHDLLEVSGVISRLVWCEASSPHFTQSGLGDSELQKKFRLISLGIGGGGSGELSDWCSRLGDSNACPCDKITAALDLIENPWLCAKVGECDVRRGNFYGGESPELRVVRNRAERVFEQVVHAITIEIRMVGVKSAACGGTAEVDFSPRLKRVGNVIAAEDFDVIEAQGAGASSPEPEVRDE